MTSKTLTAVEKITFKRSDCEELGDHFEAVVEDYYPVKGEVLNESDYIKIRDTFKLKSRRGGGYFIDMFGDFSDRQIKAILKEIKGFYDNQ